jgi:hypothetical protein
MQAFPDFLAKDPAQFVIHLLDLHDLLEGGADEIAQRFPRLLTQNAQAGREGLGLFQPWVARESGKDFPHRQIEAKIIGHRRVGQAGPHRAEGVALLPNQAGTAVDPTAPASVRRPFPGEGLAAGQSGVEIESMAEKGKGNRGRFRVKRDVGGIHGRS